MATRIVTDVAANAEPVTLADAKTHLRLDDMGGVAHPHDALITTLVRAARLHAEHYCNRAFAAKTLEYATDALPFLDDNFRVDIGPIDTVASVKYRDTNDVVQTLDPAMYFAEDVGDKDHIFLTPPNAWPQCGSRKQGVRVLYDTPADCPETVQDAIKLLVAHLYNNPSATITGTIITQVPFAIEALLDSAKVWRDVI